MKLFVAAILVAGLLGFCSPKSHAQVNFGTPDNTFTYTSINNGTGGLVGVPIPGSGMQINVATGSAALPLQNINSLPGVTHVSLGDDSGINVPLGFTFPYWGQNFTNSWMYSNGIVSFVNGNIPGAGCCGGQNLPTLAQQRNTTYNYMIAPLWTDLIDVNNNATYYLRGPGSMTYAWYNTHEYYNNNLSSFEVNINSSGAFDIRYGSAFVSTGHIVTSGITGDLSQGQYFQYYYGNGFNVPAGSPVSYGTTGGVMNMCVVNPLSDPSCPNYATAYHDQQCLVNPLFMSDCPGYAAANLTYQCSINPLYSTSCSGYQRAYHDQQCSINPLFAMDCNGYQQAYHDQQCSISVLFATDCPGYAQAYFTQQCNLNSLYSSNCPGYQAAYFNQQCQANGLYDRTCPNYATAYATQQALQQSQISTTTSSTTTTTTTAVVTTVSTTAPPAAGTVSSTGTISNPTTVPVIADATVNAIVTNNSSGSSTTSTTLPTSVASVTQTTTTLATDPSAVSVSTTTTSSSSNSSSSSPSSGGTSSSTGASNSVSTTSSFSAPVASNSSGSGTKPAPPTKAQVAAAVKTAQSNAESSKSMDEQVKTQGVVIGAMGYVQGFDAYNVTLKDAPFYKPYSIYGGQKTVDNRRASRGLFGASDVRHDEMVQSQYK